MPQRSNCGTINVRFKKLCKAFKAAWFVLGLVTCQLMLKGIEFLNQWARLHILLHSEFSLFCSTLTFHREIRRLPSVLYPREQESPTNWHWYNLQVMAACLQARGCLRIYCVCACVCVCMTRGGTQHHWCGHRAKVHSEMCGLGSRGAMASVNGEGRVSASALTLSSFSRLLCHLHFSPWHAWRPPPFCQVTEAWWRWRKSGQQSRTAGC